MKQVVDINTGELAVRSGEYILQAIALGSCIAVAAYAPKIKLGGMVHIMLPGNSPEKTDNKIKYAFDGIEQLIKEIVDSGADYLDIEVCLIGAGNVLKKADDNICSSNISSVTEILQHKNITVRACVLGGFKRKNAFLDVQSGVVFYSEGDDSTQILWQYLNSGKSGIDNNEYTQEKNKIRI